LHQVTIIFIKNCKNFTIKLQKTPENVLALDDIAANTALGAVWGDDILYYGESNFGNGNHA